MKKELRFLLLTMLIIALAAGVPTYFQWQRDQAREALLSRPPASATRILRKALAQCTEVRIHSEVNDDWTARYYPSQSAKISELGQPTFILRDEAMRDLVAALHAEKPGASRWASFDDRNEPGAVWHATALQFYRGDKWIAEIRIGDHYGLRWCTPVDYNGDAPLLPESKKYVEQLTGVTLGNR